MTKWVYKAVAIVGVAGLSLSSLACGTAKPKMTGTHWVATRTDVQDLKAARRYCQGLALDQIVEIANEGLAIKAGLDFYAACMVQQGWQLQDEEPAAKPAS